MCVHNIVYFQDCPFALVLERCKDALSSHIPIYQEIPLIRLSKSSSPNSTATNLFIISFMDWSMSNDYFGKSQVPALHFPCRRLAFPTLTPFPFSRLCTENLDARWIDHATQRVWILEIPAATSSSSRSVTSAPWYPSAVPSSSFGTSLIISHLAGTRMIHEYVCTQFAWKNLNMKVMNWSPSECSGKILWHHLISQYRLKNLLATVQTDGL